MATKQANSSSGSGKLAALGLRMTDVKANQGNEPLPKGKHPFLIERFEETAAGDTGKFPGALMYKVGLKRTGDKSVTEHAGKWCFDNILIAGERAEDNLGRLKALCLAAGVAEDVVNSDDFDPNTEWGEENLIGKHVDAEVYTTKASAEYKAGNGIDSYHEHMFSDDDLI